MVNPHLQHLTFSNQNEQNLYDSLIEESIQNFGIDVVYIQKTTEKLDLLFGEDVLKKYQKHYMIEMYLETFDGFLGDGFMASKFGYQIVKQASFVVSRKRFLEEVQIDPNVHVRPMEGDWIYVPMTKDIYEIVRADHEALFWQLGKTYAWKLSVEKVAYSSERIETGIDDIDRISLDNALTEGPLFTITLDSGGWGYVTAPTVTISGGGGTGALATATINGTGNVTGITITNNGTGYTSKPTVAITGGSGYGARATARMVDNLSTKNLGANNDLIQTQSDPILDFSEKDPFSGGRY